MLTFNDTEEKAVEKAIAALADIIPLEAIQPPRSPALVFPGLEIRLHQRRVLKNGIDVSLTRLEYGALCYLAASPGRVFTKAQIFEAVWSMGSESCQSSVTNVICKRIDHFRPYIYFPAQSLHFRFGSVAPCPTLKSDVAASIPRTRYRRLAKPYLTGFSCFILSAYKSRQKYIRLPVEISYADFSARAT